MGAERRAELRGAREERLFVQVEAEDENGEKTTDTLACSTLDVSATGMRLRLHEAVTPGQSLKLWVEVKGCPGKFMLSGMVRWCCPVNDNFSCGVELYADDEETDDLADWQELFV